MSGSTSSSSCASPPGGRLGFMVYGFGFRVFGCLGLRVADGKLEKRVTLCRGTGFIKKNTVPRRRKGVRELPTCSTNSTNLLTPKPLNLCFFAEKSASLQNTKV